MFKMKVSLFGLFMLATSLLHAQHSATLSCTPSVSNPMGYNAYRGDVGKLNPSILPTCNYVDSTVQAGATVTYTMRAVDSLGNESGDSNAVTVTIPGGVPPPPPPPPPPPIDPPPGSQTFFLPTDTPARVDDTDINSVELGMKFTVTTTGQAVGVRFYRSPQSATVHTGHLWGTGTTALATMTFSGETASGWQQALFSTPVNLTAGTQYIISYHTTHYGWTQSYFSTARTVGNITVPVDAGIYCYSASACKPNTSWLGPRAANYFVDVIFAPSAPPPPVTILISPTAPTVQVGQTQQFLATVGNTTNLAVNWTRTSACGTVSTSGLFTATAVSNPCTVTATSQADSTKSATATLMVTPAPQTLTSSCVLQSQTTASSTIVCTSVSSNHPAGSSLSSTVSVGSFSVTKDVPLP